VTAPVVGLVGCGRWGSAILRDLVELGCVVVVADPDPAVVGGALAAGAREVVDDVTRLPAVEGIVVSSPTRTHGAAVEAGLVRDDVPIFVEKPITTDLDALETWASIASDRVFEMHKWRSHPGVEALASLARSGALGAVRSLHTERIGWVGAHHDVDPIWLLAPHDLSIGLEILGELPQPVSARITEVAGVPAALNGRLGPSPTFTLELSGRSRVVRRRVHLRCDDGEATLPDPYATDLLVIRTSSGGRCSEERVPLEQEPPLRRELRSFLDHLAGGPPPRSSLDDSVAVISAIVALRRLAATSTG
jgi:predicted dehydrogenase